MSSNDSSDEATLDALPYIDDVNHTEAHRQLALQIIQEECKNYPLTKNYLEHLPEPNYDRFLTPRLKEEIERIQEKREPERIDLLRYEGSRVNRFQCINKFCALSSIAGQHEQSQ